MRLFFSYDLDKDVYNFIRTSNSTHNPQPTKFHQQFTADTRKSLDDVTAVKKYIEEYFDKYKSDIENSINKIKKEWGLIEDQFIERSDSLFKYNYPDDIINVYLTTNQRCSYSTDNNNFFVYVFSKSPNLIIMHELQHFYTKEVFYRKILDAGLSEKEYEDIKESLTELLNIEFKDLLGGAVDNGYLQHQATRKLIREFWSQTPKLNKLVDFLIQNKDL